MTVCRCGRALTWAPLGRGLCTGCDRHPRDCPCAPLAQRRIDLDQGGEEVPA